MLPPRRILAAVDFSEESHVAAGLAARLAQQCQAELHVLHAEDPLLAAAARAAGIELDVQTRDELDTFSSDLVPPPSRRHVATGPATDVICDVAAREHADLIVVGARGMSGSERLMFGSITEGVLRNADASILVVPSGWTPAASSTMTGLGPIIVGIDFSGAALGAAAAGCRLANALETHVELVHVVPELKLPARWAPHAEEVIAHRMQSARAELTDIAKTLAADAPLEFRVVTGPIADTLATIARNDEVGHPMLLLGRRTRADRGGAPGAIAYRLLMLTQLPVLVHLPDAEGW